MINLREIILGALMDIVEEEQYSHIVLKDVLEKYQYLDKRDRAFITRVTEGTLENMLQMDYIIERFSKVKVENMKPVIRNILRMSVYQLKYMDSVPDSAVCNEGVRLAQKRGFYQLKGFVNGVLRSVARNLDKVEYPSKEKQPLLYLSVTYSMPEWIVKSWCELYGFDAVEKICQDMHEEKPTSIRCNLDKTENAPEAENISCFAMPAVNTEYTANSVGSVDSSYAITKNCKNVDAAVVLLKYWTSAEAAGILLYDYGRIPCTDFDMDESKLTPLCSQAIKVMGEQKVLTPWFDRVDTDLGNEFNNTTIGIANGDDVQESFDNLQNYVESKSK